MASVDRKERALRLDDRPVPDRRRSHRAILSHIAIVCGGILAAVVLIVLIDLFAPDWVRVMLLDRERATYPLTIQTCEWVAFGFGLGELVVRARDAIEERAQLRAALLPEDESTILHRPDLRRIYASTRIALHASPRSHFLPRLVQRIVLQFQANRSVSEANALLTSSMELFQHEIDLRYTLIRYTIWVLPTLGFLGTVMGISLALRYAGEANPRDPNLLHELTKILAVKFDTTLVALALSAILVLLQHLIQRYEESALNAVGQYTIDNLVNRLVEE